MQGKKNETAKMKFGIVFGTAGGRRGRGLGRQAGLWREKKEGISCFRKGVEMEKDRQKTEYMRRMKKRMVVFTK